MRSNRDDRPGFAAVENRALVAMSRAKLGLYIVGDGQLFEKQGAWAEPIRLMKDRGQFGDTLPLVCPNHGGLVTLVNIKYAYCVEKVYLSCAYALGVNIKYAYQCGKKYTCFVRMLGVCVYKWDQK